MILLGKNTMAFFIGEFFQIYEVLDKIWLGVSFLVAMLLFVKCVCARACLKVTYSILF